MKSLNYLLILFVIVSCLVDKEAPESNSVTSRDSISQRQKVIDDLTSSKESSQEINPPSKISLVKPLSSLGLNNTPTLKVSGVSLGFEVKIYKDAECTQLVGTETATKTSVEITTSELSAGRYTFYATATDDGITSECSSASVSYRILSCPSDYIFVPGNSGLGTSDSCMLKSKSIAQEQSDIERSNKVKHYSEIKTEEISSSKTEPTLKRGLVRAKIKSLPRSGKSTSIAEIEPDPCNVIGKNPVIARDQIQVELINGRSIRQTWKEVPFVVINKDSVGLNGPFCALQAIDPKTGIAKGERIFKTTVSSLIGSSGQVKTRPWQLPESSLEKAKRKSVQDDVSEKLKPMVNYVAGEKQSPDCDPSNDIAKAKFETCNRSNNYLEGVLRAQVSTEELESNDNMKACISAALGWRLDSRFRNPSKYAQCNSSGQQVNTSNPRKRPCYSNNYATYVYKELKEIISCFDGVTLEEILPLAFSESEFGINSYNTNYNGSLNASGMLGLTQVVINSIDSYFLKTDKYYNNTDPKCKKMNDDMFDRPFMTSKMLKRSRRKRNVCNRVKIPGGFKKNLFYTLKQYSFLKNVKLKDGIFNRTVNRMIHEFGEEYFEQKDLENIKISLLRMMHNRGSGAVAKYLRYFKKDLLKANGKLHSLWKGSELGPKISHGDFNKYFSSYFYHERRKHYKRYRSKEKTNRSKRRASTAADGGGVYLNRADCFQALMEKQYEKQYGKIITCGSHSLSDEAKENIKFALERGSCQLSTLKGPVENVLKRFYK